MTAIYNTEEIMKRALFMAAFLAPVVDPINAEKLRIEFEDKHGKNDQ